MQSRKEIARLGEASLRTLLRPVPQVQAGRVKQVKQDPPAAAGQPSVSGRLPLHHNGQPYTLVIMASASGAPRSARAAIQGLQHYLMSAALSTPGKQGDLVPMLVSPYLSPESRALCAEHKIGYLDLVGNAQLSFGSIYIERSLADKPKAEVRALRSIFSPKAGVILRALLASPNRPWRVAELAEAAGASLGHVSNVRKALVEREWAEAGSEGMALVKPQALIKAWRESYRRPQGQRRAGYTRLHGEALTACLSQRLNPNPGRPRAIYALHSAASWHAPFGRDGMHSFYADTAGAALLEEALELAPAAKGANVELLALRDDSLFMDASEPAPGIFCTNPIVTYLDLWAGNDRDREAAEHLGKRIFPWQD